MIIIINYGIGNLTSIFNILKKIGAKAAISSDKADILNAEKLILPGVGNFDHCMKQFNSSGLREAVEKKVFEFKTPVLGICAGCQMLMQKSEEGNEPGLGWIDGEVVHFDTSLLGADHKIPHMGWTKVHRRNETALYTDMDELRFYFVHSYHIHSGNTSIVTGTASYGYEFIASVAKDNIQGVQFHPEKSHRFGMQLYSNFNNRF